MNIKELAEQAGFGFDGYYDYVTQEALERFAELVAAAERESCAKLCDEQWGFEIAKFCAKLIRGRRTE